MATKQFCDRCGFEIKGQNRYFHKRWDGGDMESIIPPQDLCVGCYKLLIRFMNNEVTMAAERGGKL